MFDKHHLLIFGAFMVGGGDVPPVVLITEEALPACHAGGASGFQSFLPARCSSSFVVLVSVGRNVLHRCHQVPPLAALLGTSTTHKEARLLPAKNRTVQSMRGQTPTQPLVWVFHL